MLVVALRGLKLKFEFLLAQGAAAGFAVGNSNEC